MIDLMSLPPGLVMVLGSILVPFIPHISRQIYMLFLILWSSYGLFLGFGVHTSFEFSNIEFIIFQTDKLVLPFSIIFHFAAGLS